MKYYIFIIIIFTCWNCTTLKPNSAGVSPFDINKRTEIQNPTYYGGLNALGAGSIIAGTLGGAYAGYQSKAIQYNSGVEQKTLDVGNIIIGAVVGYTFSYYGNRLLGWGKMKKASDYKKWLYKVNPDYTLLNNSQPNVIRAIHSSAESNFTVNKLSDAHDFAQAFKNSSYTDKLIDQSLSSKTLLLSDFADMARTFAKANNAVKLKKEYIHRSDNVTELFEGVAKYPNVISENEIQLKSSDLINNLSDFKKYKERFKGLEYDDKIFSNIYNKIPKVDLLYLIRQQPRATKIDDAKQVAIEKTDVMIDLKALSTEYGSKYKNIIEQKAEKLVMTDRILFKDFIAIFPNAQRLIHKSNTYYLGDINSQRQFEGMGIFWNDNVDIYQIGTFQAGKLSGLNCREYSYGYIYEGGYLNGKKSGYGKRYNNEQKGTDGYEEYEGYFQNDKYHGQGKYAGNLQYIIPKEFGYGTYDGLFADGDANGTGKYYHVKDKASYEGQFKDGKHEGKGTYTFGNGVTASGPFKNSEPNGQFHLTFAQRIKSGIFDFWPKIYKEELSREVHSFDELILAQSDIVKMINNEISSDNSSKSENSSSSSDSQDQRQEKEQEQEEEVTKKREREEEKYQKENQKARESFIESISFKDMGITKFGIGYNGVCPCNDLELIKENGLWKSNDAFHIYKDKNDHYYFYNSWPMADKGPYSLESIKEIIYEENYKPKRK